MDPISIIQSSLIYHFKTGYLYIDIFLTILIVYLAKKIVEYFPSIWELIKKLWIFGSKVKSEYIIQGTVTISTEYCSHSVNFPIEYRALMYVITQMSVDIKNGRHFNVLSKFDSNNNDKYIGNFSYSINTSSEIQITKDIYVKQTNSIDKSTDLKSSIEFFNLYVYSYTLSFIELKKQLDKWFDQYNKFIKEYNDGNLYYFSYTGTNKQDKTDTIVKFESHKFSTNKSFDNIFFKDKNKLLDRINYFLNNTDDYARLGIPHTLGILFFGIPGCGKTSTIKAIANYTKRHIVEIQLSKIKTCTELKNIFFNDMINEQYVPSNRKILVLEDFDCMGDIVQKRSCCDELQALKNAISSELVKDKKEILDDMLKTAFEEDQDKLNLSYILNLIDGVLEQHGRIMIITSNHPEKLDDALIRPGRIDMKVHFTKCNKNIIGDILKLYFKKESIEDINFKDDVFTPAEVFELCFNLNNYEKVVDHLTNCNNSTP